MKEPSPDSYQAYVIMHLFAMHLGLAAIAVAFIAGMLLF